MNIPDIVLHELASSQLDDFVRSPAHAVLLSGPHGTGKTHIAVHLAGTMLGTDRQSLENQPYFRTVAPKNGSTSIEQIRELVGFFRLKVPGTAAIKRSAVIEDAEMMGLEAQNALLKLLEEPPADSVLILTSSQPQNLLATIRSRAQLVHLPAPEVSMLENHFVANGYDKAAVSGALLRNGTDVSAAAAALAGEGNGAENSVQLVKQALGGSSYERLLLVDGLAKQKDMATGFASTLATVAMASLQTAANRGAGTVDRWRDILQAAHTAEDALSRSGNAKLVLTELMLAL